MSKTWRWFVVVAALLMTSGLAGAAWLHWSRPTVLKVAVGPSGFADAELMAAFSRTLSSNKSNVQLTVEHTAGPSEAVGKLINGETQLAVMRGDGPTSDSIRAVAILHTDPIVIVVPEKSKVDDFGDLNGKTVGLIGPPGADDALLGTLRRHYGVTGEPRHCRCLRHRSSQASATSPSTRCFSWCRPAGHRESPRPGWRFGMQADANWRSFPSKTLRQSPPWCPPTKPARLPRASSAGLQCCRRKASPPCRLQPISSRTETFRTML